MLFTDLCKNVLLQKFWDFLRLLCLNCRLWRVMYCVFADGTSHYSAWLSSWSAVMLESSAWPTRGWVIKNCPTSPTFFSMALATQGLPLIFSRVGVEQPFKKKSLSCYLTWLSEAQTDIPHSRTFCTTGRFWHAFWRNISDCKCNVRADICVQLLWRSIHMYILK